MRFARQSDLSSPRLLICLSSPSRKNISVLYLAKSLHKRRRLAPVEGRIAIVTDVEAGCGGRGGAQDEARYLRTAKSCGPGISTLMPSCAEVSAR